MARIAGIYLTAQGPRNGKTAKLWASGSFASPPSKNTALPSGSPLQSTTTGTTHGGDGQYRFSGVTAGAEYYVSIEDGTTITYDTHTLAPAGTASGNVKTAGAVGDGTTDDTVAINSVLADTSIGRVYFPPGTYKVTDLLVSARAGLIVEGEGATISVTGTGASGNPQGLKIAGGVSDITIRNLRFLGDGTAANYQAGIWAETGDIEGLRIENCHFQSLAAGVWLSRSSGAWESILIDHCEFEAIVGTGANQGLGVYYSNASGTAQHLLVRDCEFFSSGGSHAIQFANGKGMAAVGNFFQSNRSAVATAAVVAAVTVRGLQIRVEGNTFSGCYDGAIQVKPASASVVRGVVIRGNQIDAAGNAVADITIGTSDPATDGAVDNLVLADNVIRKDGISAAAIDVFTARCSQITGNVMHMLAVGSANTPMIELEGAGEGAGTASYTDEVTLAHNVGFCTLSGGTVNGIRLESAFCTSGADARFFGNSFAGAAANFQTVTTITNDNLIVADMLTTGLSFDSASQMVELDAGPLDLNAGLRLTRREQATNFSVTSLETCIFAAGGAGGITLTLPAMTAAMDGLPLAIFKSDDTSGAVTINATGTDGLFGPATGTLNLSKAYDGIFLIADYNSTKPFWRIVGQVGLKQSRNVTSITNADSPYTLLDSDDFVIANTTAGNITVNLPAQAGRKGWHYSFFKSAAGNTLTLDGSGAETVEGGATLALAGGPGITEIVQTGTNWAVVARNTANVT